mmetsp:Transcript_14474/g.41181  ORF Transcript_14474/g.41181 Transcript_14474/m.41181 type:complete len:302 (+) Transcript_14474:475-1380(+)
MVRSQVQGRWGGGGLQEQPCGALQRRRVQRILVAAGGDPLLRVAKRADGVLSERLLHQAGSSRARRDRRGLLPKHVSAGGGTGGGLCLPVHVFLCHYDGSAVRIQPRGHHSSLDCAQAPAERKEVRCNVDRVLCVRRRTCLHHDHNPRWEKGLVPVANLALPGVRGSLHDLPLVHRNSLPPELCPICRGRRPLLCALDSDCHVLRKGSRGRWVAVRESVYADGALLEHGAHELSLLFHLALWLLDRRANVPEKVSCQGYDILPGSQDYSREGTNKDVAEEAFGESAATLHPEGLDESRQPQ